LPGQGVHQVEVEGVKSAGSFFQRCNGLRTVVHPAQSLQMRIVEALHTDRQSRHAGRTESPEAVFLKSAGVGL